MLKMGRGKGGKGKGEGRRTLIIIKEIGACREKNLKEQDERRERVDKKGEDGVQRRREREARSRARHWRKEKRVITKGERVERRGNEGEE